MKTRICKIGTAALFSLPALILSLSAAAHEPEKHAENAQAPDCAAMQHMNRDEMDKDDPVMQALMEQCMSDMEAMDGHSEPSEDADHSGNGEQAESAAEHQH